MSVSINNTTIITFKGDSCPITFTGLVEGMVIYFGVRDKKNNSLVFDELHGVVDSQGDITFVMTPEMTNKFVISPSEGVNTYYYGIKEVDETTGEENTILLGDNPKFSDKYLIKAYLKKVEGIEEENG